MNDEINVVFTVPYLDLPITNAIIMSWITMAIIILFAFLATRKMTDVPGKLQNIAEIFVEFIYSFFEGFMGKATKTYAPYIGTVGLFLVIANTIGALFMSDLTKGLIAPPARSLGIAAALALMTITIAIVSGLRAKGIKGFIKKLFKPVAFMFPFNVLEFITKPLSLGMRLYGNILGAFILMELLISNFPWAVPSVVSLYFDLFDGGLQAFVFIFLTAIYISEEIKEEEE